MTLFQKSYYYKGSIEPFNCFVIYSKNNSNCKFWLHESSLMDFLGYPPDNSLSTGESMSTLCQQPAKDCTNSVFVPEFELLQLIKNAPKTADAELFGLWIYEFLPYWKQEIEHQELINKCTILEQKLKSVEVCLERKDRRLENIQVALDAKTKECIKYRTACSRKQDELVEIRNKLTQIQQEIDKKIKDTITLKQMMESSYQSVQEKYDQKLKIQQGENEKLKEQLNKAPKLCLGLCQLWNGIFSIQLALNWGGNSFCVVDQDIESYIVIGDPVVCKNPMHVWYQVMDKLQDRICYYNVEKTQFKFWHKYPHMTGWDIYKMILDEIGQEEEN